MEGQDLQAIILHDNSQCIIQSTFQRWLLHPRIAETMLLSGNLKNLEEFQYTAYNWLGAMPDAWQIISTLVRWKNWMEKQSNSTQGLSTRIRFKVPHWRSRTSLECTSGLTTGIGKSPDDPCEFQLQPNEEIKQHAPRQVPINLQGVLHQENQCTMEQLIKEVTKCVSSLEIVDGKVPADFNTGDTDWKARQFPRQFSRWQWSQRPTGQCKDIGCSSSWSQHWRQGQRPPTGPFTGHKWTIPRIDHGLRWKSIR